MSRIVAGSVGGRSIAVPGKGTRPTSDRVREAMFSRLQHLDVVDGARVLDLYAGSGALGLEAASRGAAAVTLVDSARAAADVARKNVATLGLAGVRVVADTAERFAAALAGVRPGDVAAGRTATTAPRAGTAGPTAAAPRVETAGPTAAAPRAGTAGPAVDRPGFDLVFLDPPYDLGEEALGEVLAHLAAPGVLADGAVVVVERSTRTPEPDWPDGLALFSRKDYGETVVYYAEPAVPDPGGPSDSVSA